MFKLLFLVTLFVTLAVNLIFLFATKDKPPDQAISGADLLTEPGSVAFEPSAAAAAASLARPLRQDAGVQQAIKGTGLANGRQKHRRRLFLRSNELYDYASSSGGGGALSPRLENKLANRILFDVAGATNDNYHGRPSATSENSDRARKLQADEDNETRTGQRQRLQMNLVGPAQSRPEVGLSKLQMDNDDDDDDESRSKAGGVDELSLAPSHETLAPEAAEPVASSGISSNSDHDVAIGSSNFDNNTQLRAYQNSSMDSLAIKQTNGVDGLNRKLAGAKQTNPEQTTAPDVAQLQHLPSANDKLLEIRVKSSKNHVFISIDKRLIYESKQEVAQASTTTTTSTTTTLQSREPLEQIRVLTTPNQTSNGSSSGSNLNMQERDNLSRHHHHHRRRWPTNQIIIANGSTTTTTTSGEFEAYRRQAHRKRQTHRWRQATVELEVDEAESRGLHVLVLNQFDGSIMSRRVFDTYSAGQDNELSLYLRQISDGRLLVLAVKDEASFQMAVNSEARKLLQQLGSKYIKHLQFRDMWAFVVRKSSLLETAARIGEPGSLLARRQMLRNQLDMNLAEGISKASAAGAWAEPVIVEARVQLLDELEDDDDQYILGADTNIAPKAPLPVGQHATSERQRRKCEWNKWARLSNDRNDVHNNDKDDDNDDNMAISGRFNFKSITTTSSWPFNYSDSSFARRADFCSRIEGYGRVCDCNYPAPISFNQAKIQGSQLDEVPIVVIAGNRPYYLYRMLRSLLQADGVDPKRVIVFIDGFYEEPLEVSKLFNLRAIQQRPAGRKSARISHHYKMSLTATFELFPRAEFALIFEEDLDIAKDALIYFNHTVDLLRNDPSLYCASAWNDQGYEHSVKPSRNYDEMQLNTSTSFEPQPIYRIETMPGLGWLLSRRLFKDELELRWPSFELAHDWDMWIRTESVRRGRECLIPDVSRTYHFGAVGTNINSYFQRQYFAKHAFSNYHSLANSCCPNTTFTDASKLEKRAYEHLIESLINRATVITQLHTNRPPTTTTTSSTSASNNGTTKAATSDLEHVCSLMSPLFNNTTGFQQAGRQDDTPTVIYIKMIDRLDYKNWLKLATCWRIWDLDARGQHKSMWRLFVGARMTLVVGVPASPYSHLKPADLVPFDFK